MTAPTISALPDLPTFPSGPGLPDQPGEFIPKFLLFLAALGVWRTEVNALAEYLDGLSVGGGGSGATFIPLVTGAEPPALVSDGAGQLILVPWSP